MGVAKYWNKRVECVGRIFEDAVDRVTMGHLNSLSDTSKFHYEGASETLMLRKWEDGLVIFPRHLIHLNPRETECFDHLVSAFHVEDPGSERIYPPKEVYGILKGDIVVVPFEKKPCCRWSIWEWIRIDL